MRIAFLLIAAASALMSACSSENVVVTERHIQVATEKCSVNGGVKSIVDAKKDVLYEQCGYRCSKETNQHEYKATFSCKNGARFDLIWTE